MDYGIKYDYHTHTVFSHGKGSIEDNVRAAVQKGLCGIAISDHGPGHLLYGVERDKIKNMRGEIERLRGVYQNIDIYLAVEANIMDAGNCLDVGKSETGSYDFIIAGYHYGVRGGFCVRNFICCHSPVHLPGRDRLKSQNTEMAVRAIYENPIKILTHPGDKGPFDITEIAKACAERGTWMEINSGHKHLTVEGIREAAKTDVKFVICSDAHTPERVGSCENGIKRALDAGLDMERIVNIADCNCNRALGRGKNTGDNLS